MTLKQYFIFRKAAGSQCLKLRQFNLWGGDRTGREVRRMREEDREQIKREKYFKKDNTARRQEGQRDRTSTPEGTSSLGLESILSDQFPYFLLSEDIVEQGTLFSLFFYSLFLFLFLVCNRILGETFFFFCLFVFKERSSVWHENYTSERKGNSNSWHRTLTQRQEQEKTDTYGQDLQTKAGR